MRFKADEDIMDALVHLRKKKGTGGAEGSNCPRASPGDVALGARFTLTIPGSFRNHPNS